MLKLSKEEFEAEKAKKQKYLNDEIISKGYNPEDLSNFIIRMKGQPPDYMLFEDYVDIIEDFKNEKLTKKLTPYWIMKSNNAMIRPTTRDVAITATVCLVSVF